VKTINKDSIFNNICPTIQKSMSREQISESKRLINIALHSNIEENIEIQGISEDLIFEKINPLIEESMSNEQKRESKRLIKLSLPKQTKKILAINLCFWFFRLFYITFYLGHEKRNKSRQFNKNFIWEVFLMFISSVFVLSIALSLVFAIFLALYYIKSLMGVDLFDAHLLK